ncbi:MAG: hypothetical protein ACPGU7_09870 [Gammaproteobacteria bacterium]
MADASGDEDGDFESIEISPEQFAIHKDAFTTWYDWFAARATVVVLITFAGYGLGFWIWYGGDNLSAIIVVTTFYLLFRLHRRLIFMWAEKHFTPDPAFAEPIRLLGRLRRARNEQAALTHLKALIDQG